MRQRQGTAGRLACQAGPLLSSRAMQLLSGLLALSMLAISATSAMPISGSGSGSGTVAIAPGVHLPLASIGGVHDFPSNYSLWLALGGRGLDTADIYDHGDHDVQYAVGAAVRSSGLKRAEML